MASPYHGFSYDSTRKKTIDLLFNDLMLGKLSRCHVHLPPHVPRPQRPPSSSDPAATRGDMLGHCRMSDAVLQYLIAVTES
jgi:hypothetical protein